MRIASSHRPGPSPRVGASHPGDAGGGGHAGHAGHAVGQRARLIRAGQRARGGLSPSGARHLQAGTAHRALSRNLAHLHRCLADPRLPDHERRALAQSVATLEVTLRDHQALRTRMAAIIMG